MQHIRIFAVIMAVLFTAAGVAQGTVSEFTSFAAWQQAAGTYTTIDFTGFPKTTVITTQYSHLGFTITDLDNAVIGPSMTTFPQDGWALRGGANEHIMVELSAPAYVFAAHHPGTIQFRLFLDDAVVYTSTQFQGSHSGYDGFSGIISTTPFNRVRIWDWVDHLVYVDNFYVDIPGPAALGVFAIAALSGGSRRRRS